MIGERRQVMIAQDRHLKEIRMEERCKFRWKGSFQAGWSGFGEISYYFWNQSPDNTRITSWADIYSHSSLTINHISLKCTWPSIHQGTCWLQVSKLKSNCKLTEKDRRVNKSMDLGVLLAWVQISALPLKSLNLCVDLLISKVEIKTESISKVCWELYMRSYLWSVICNAQHY